MAGLFFLEDARPFFLDVPAKAAISIATVFATGLLSF
jgi:hypothetical protein